MNFADDLDRRQQALGHPCLVGIDPHLSLLPEEFAAARDTTLSRADRAASMLDFCRQLLEVVADRAVAVKPQSAFFEVLGADGVVAWEDVIVQARAAGVLVIGDLKRNDIASSAEAYAEAHLDRADPRGCDAMTVSPYLGSDTLEPFVARCAESDTGTYVLVRTSNPGSAEFQRCGEPAVCEAVAKVVARVGERVMGDCGLSSIGAVVGATHPGELARMRELMPHTPFLLPGYGAQGATGKDLADAFLPGGRGVLVNASRSISFAYRKPERAGLHWKDAASQALDEMIEDLRSVSAGTGVG